MSERRQSGLRGLRGLALVASALQSALLPACGTDESSAGESPDGAKSAPSRSMQVKAGAADRAAYGDLSRAADHAADGGSSAAAHAGPPALEEWPASASHAQMTGELGIQVDASVPADVAEELHRLMSELGCRMKVLRCTTPGEYTINAWGGIPHAATEFTVRRAGAGWQILRDESWVLIGGA